MRRLRQETIQAVCRIYVAETRAGAEKVNRIGNVTARRIANGRKSLVLTGARGRFAKPSLENRSNGAGFVLLYLINLA